MATGGGASIYTEFLDNSFKHKETRLTNEMGLGTVVSFSDEGIYPTQWKMIHRMSPQDEVSALCGNDPEEPDGMC